MDLETSGLDVSKDGIVSVSFRDSSGETLDLKVNPENALEYTNKKFIKRFQYLEEGEKKTYNISVKKSF